MAKKEKEDLLTRIRPHAEWDAIKWGWEAAKSSVLALAYWLFQRLRHVHVDFIGVAILFVLTMILGYLMRRSKLPLGDETSFPAEHLSAKLAIYSANYLAIDGTGTHYPVTECLRQMIKGDSLILDIENHNFVVGNRNFVPKDPKDGIKKYLQVEYSYDGESPKIIERLEGRRLVLPEDTYLNDPALTMLQRDALQLSANLVGFVQRMGPGPAPSYTKEEIDSMPEAKSRQLINTHDGDYAEACEFYSPGNPLTSEAYTAAIRVRWKRLYPWYQKVKTAYDNDFRGDIGKLRSRFFMQDIADDDQLLLQVDGKDGVSNILKIASKLWELAYRAGEKGTHVEST